jgi:outer membrane protein assembly factor BamB
MTRLSLVTISRRSELPLKRVLLLCLWWLPWTVAHAQVQPIWSVPLGETMADTLPRAIEDAYVLADGSVHFRSYGATSRASLRLFPDGAVVRGQEYDALTGEIVADQGQRLMVSRSDGVQAVSVLVRDLAGEVLWTRDLPLVSARFFADGDVLAYTGNQIMRLRAHDGVVRWKRELLDLHPYAESTYFAFADDIDTQIDLGGRLWVKRSGMFSAKPVRWQAALDPTDGSVRWSRRFGPEAPPNNEDGCGTLVNKGVVVWICESQAFGAGGWIYTTKVRLYRHGDGLQWLVTLPERTTNLQPLVAIGANHVHLAMHSAEEVHLASLDIDDGARLWEAVLPGGYEVKVEATIDDDLLYGIRRSAGSDEAITTIGRHRAADGAPVWAVQVAQAQPGVTVWRQSAGSLGVATVRGIPDDARARVENRSLVTGELLASAEDSVTGRRSVPFATALVGSAYCHAAAAAPDAATLQCLSGTSGTPMWTQAMPTVAPGDAITGIWLSALPPDRIVLITRYTRTVGDSSVNLFSATAVEVALGMPVWRQADLPVQPIFLATDDDGALMTHANCPVPPGCPGLEQLLDRISGSDGSRLWSRPIWAQALAQREDRVILYRASPQTPQVLALDARNGSDAWTTPLPQGVLGTVGALVSPQGNLVVENARTLAGTTRQIEVRGFNRALGSERWLVTPSIPSNFTSDSVLWPLEGESMLVSGILRLNAGNTVPWMAAIDAATGSVHWEKVATLGRDSSRRAVVVGAAPDRDLWLSGTRDSPYNLQRKAIFRLGPQNGSLGGEHQYASSRDLSPHDPSGLAVPDGLLADGSVLARAWRGVDGYAFPVLQRWPAPSGPNADVILELESLSPVLGHGPSAMVDLRIENRSAHAVAGVRPVFIPTWSGQTASIVGCIAVSGTVQCIPAMGDDAGMKLDLGAGAVGRVRFEVFGPNYIPAASSDNGTVHFHIDLPFDVGDDLGDNRVEARIWLGGTSNGFE